MYCINHIAQLGRLAPDLKKKGFRILVIGKAEGPAAQDAAAAFAGHLDLLNDPTRAVYKSYGFGKVAMVVQRSGTVIVDRNQIIRYMHCTPNPKTSFIKDEFLVAIDTVA